MVKITNYIIVSEIMLTHDEGVAQKANCPAGEVGEGACSSAVSLWPPSPSGNYTVATIFVIHYMLHYQ